MTIAFHRQLDVLCADPVRLLENSIRNNFGLRLKRWALVVGRPLRCFSRIGLRCGSVPARSRPRHRLSPVWKTGRWVCPRTECRYHLAEFMDAPKASPGCALIYAGRGSMGSEKLSTLIGVTRQRVDQIEADGLSRLDLVRGLREFVERPDGAKIRLTAEERILSVLRVGPASADRIARESKINEQSARRILRSLESQGRARARTVGPRSLSRLWYLIEEPETNR